MKYLISKICIILIFLYFIKTSKYLIDKDSNQNKEHFDNLIKPLDTNVLKDLNRTNSLSLKNLDNDKTKNNDKTNSKDNDKTIDENKNKDSNNSLINNIEPYEDVKIKNQNFILFDTKNNFNKNNLKDKVLFQDYGPTNYIDPRNMTELQKENHKNYFPKNMTLQDYVNWLLLNRDNINNLEHIHTINLQNLFKNKRILEVPIDSMSNESHHLCDNQFIVKNSKLVTIQDSSSINKVENKNVDFILPSNYVNYSDYRHNFDVYGLNGKYSNRKKEIKNLKTFMTP